MGRKMRLKNEAALFLMRQEYTMCSDREIPSLFYGWEFFVKYLYLVKIYGIIYRLINICTCRRQYLLNNAESIRRYKFK